MCGSQGLHGSTGVPDGDIEHAVRHAIRQIDDDDLTILIGPARDGALLEIGVLDLECDDPVVHPRDAGPTQVPAMTKHTDSEIDSAAARLERWARIP